MTTLVDEALLRTVAARAAAYLQQVQTRGVVPSASALEGLRELNEALPDAPCPPDEILDRLDRMYQRVVARRAA